MENITILLLILLLLEVSFLVYKSVKKIPVSGRKKVFVDTSALMDGRIVTAARTGFIPDTLIIPTSVVSELQLLADQADSEKRARARRGLDAIKELQEIKNITVVVLNDGPVGDGGVDARLVELATKEPNGVLCTIDFNLNKVATISGIEVLNINELAGSIRMAFLPGETMNLALTQKGQGDNQAVGYLADGTMVVVDKAGKEVGNTVQIEFIRSLQTAAGRMMFAKLVTSKNSSVKDTQNSLPVTGQKKTAKSTGRKLPNSDGKKIAPKAKQSRTKQAAKNTASSREDSLIELVNNQ